MKTHEQAHEFAREWLAAWNAHDLDRILAHYSDDFEMSSPFIAGVAGEASGTLRGKNAVRAYWEMALGRFPDLHFELFEVFVGAQSVALCYRSVQNKRALEVFFFDASGLVCKAAAHYTESSV